MQKVLILIIVIVAVGGFVFMKSKKADNNAQLSPTPTQTAAVSTEPSPAPTVETTNKVTITYTDVGYSPSAVTIKRGDTVVFNNKSSKMMWTASAMHPSHKGYPGTDIAFCNLADETVIMFDACKEYAPSERWEFKFDNIGTWKYHNHMQANHYGSVTVE